jgi:hypothetical protein
MPRKHPDVPSGRLVSIAGTLVNHIKCVTYNGRLASYVNLRVVFMVGMNAGICAEVDESGNDRLSSLTAASESGVNHRHRGVNERRDLVGPAVEPRLVDAPQRLDDRITRADAPTGAGSSVFGCTSMSIIASSPA